MKQYSISFLLCILVMALQSCTPNPELPLRNSYYVYAPNTQIEISYYSGRNGNRITTTMAETNRFFATHILSETVGSYYPNELKEHPEWGFMTLQRKNGSSPIYITPYNYTIVGGDTILTFSNESELLAAKLEALVKEGYMLKFDDNELHQLPVSDLWGDSFSTPKTGSYPSIQI